MGIGNTVGSIIAFLPPVVTGIIINDQVINCYKNQVN